MLNTHILSKNVVLKMHYYAIVTMHYHILLLGSCKTYVYKKDLGRF